MVHTYSLQQHSNIFPTRYRDGERVRVGLGIGLGLGSRVKSMSTISSKLGQVVRRHVNKYVRAVLTQIQQDGDPCLWCTQRRARFSDVLFIDSMADPTQPNPQPNPTQPLQPKS